MNPQGRRGPRHHDFEKRKDAVERMFRGVTPGIVRDREPNARVNQSPVYRCDDEWVGGDGGVKEGMESLKRTGKDTVEDKRGAGACIGEGV